MSNEWHYRIVEEGIWLFPPDPLLRVHPEERAPWAAQVIRTLAQLPFLIRTYTLDPPRLLERVHAVRQPVRLAPGNTSPGGWVDVFCGDDTLLPVLLVSWGVTVPGWVCVVPLALAEGWTALLDDRAQRIGDSVERLPRAERLPDDHLIVYAIDESMVIARPLPDAALKALRRFAEVQGYVLVRETE
jgi:hypothetical protein